MSMSVLRLRSAAGDAGASIVETSRRRAFNRARNLKTWHSRRGFEGSYGFDGSDLGEPDDQPLLELKRAAASIVVAETAGDRQAAAEIMSGFNETDRAAIMSLAVDGGAALAFVKRAIAEADSVSDSPIESLWDWMTGGDSAPAVTPQALAPITGRVGAIQPLPLPTGLTATIFKLVSPITADPAVMFAVRSKACATGQPAATCDTATVAYNLSIKNAQRTATIAGILLAVVGLYFYKKRKLKQAGG